MVLRGLNECESLSTPATTPPMTAYENLRTGLGARRERWLVTGAAGFIGSHLLQELLEAGQIVVGLDNFATGKKANLAEVKANVTAEQWGRHTFLEGDITRLDDCRRACEGVAYVLHQAALGSVPRSIEDPRSSHEANLTGFLNMLIAARDCKVKRFVYASSSAVYGDHPELPKKEERIGRPLSPYALTKYANELYAHVFARCYGLEAIGLRYFNVFGPRQDPEGPYAAVIPKWIAALIQGQPVYVNGDGETSRDFCYVANAVQANLLAATTANAQAINRVYNVALNERTTLNQLFALLREHLAAYFPAVRERQPVYRDFRSGDVRHSQADISPAEQLLGYKPTHNLGRGLGAAMGWYKKNL